MNLSKSEDSDRRGWVRGGGGGRRTVQSARSVHAWLAYFINQFSDPTLYKYSFHKKLGLRLATNYS